jgi:hypothetical protein
VQRTVARLRDPFPARFTIGPVAFVRDDTRGPVAAAPAALGRAVPPPAPGQPDEPRWAANATALAVSADGARMLVAGARKHPRFKRDPSAPPFLASVLEVDAAGRVLLACDADRVTGAAYVDDDTIVIVGEQLTLHERHGQAGVRTQVAPVPPQAVTLFADGGRTLIRFGGVYNYDVQKVLPQTIDVVRVDERALRWGGEATVPIDVGALAGDALLVGATGAPAAYTADVRAFAATDLVTPTFVRSGLDRVGLSPRVGPWSVVDTLGLNDWCLQAGNRGCLILRHLGDNRFEALVGDAEHGVRPLDPPLQGAMDGTIVDADHGAVYLDGQAWLVELATGRATAVVDRPGTGYGFVAVTDRGFAKIIDDALVATWASGTTARVTLGAGAEVIAALYGGRHVAVRAQQSPFVVLGLGADRAWRLVGAVDPAGPRAATPVELIENPRGVFRAAVRVDGETRELLGLDAALARATPIDALPARPWDAAPIA